MHRITSRCFSLLLFSSVVFSACWAFGGDSVGAICKRIEAEGITGGLAVEVGTQSEALCVALAKRGSFLLHGLLTDPGMLQSLRLRPAVRKLGGRVSFSLLRAGGLPFVSGVVRVLVVRGQGLVTASETLRVLAPGGIALREAGKGKISVTKKEFPRGMDRWTHYLHDPSNNAVSRDVYVGPPRQMQWLAEPRWSRYHHTLASMSGLVTSGGRILGIFDEATSASTEVPSRWYLVCRDAASGVLLWKRRIPKWAWHKRRFRSGPVQLPRTLVAGEGRVFVPRDIEGPLLALDAATGKELLVYEGTGGVEELLHAGDRLFVVRGLPGPEQAKVDPTRSRLIPFPNAKEIVAVEVDTGKKLWTWKEPEGIHLVPVTLCVSEGKVFFEAGGGIVCLRASDGELLWSTAKKNSAAPRKEKRKKRRRGRGLGTRSPGWALSTVVCKGGVVLWARGATLKALSATRGTTLWEARCPNGFRSPPDVFVIGDCVWTGPGFSEGRDLKTGKVKKKIDILARLLTAGHHHRCFRQKATERYLLEDYRGVEFVDLLGTNHSRNNWVRGTCQYGVLPSYGLLYAPPHACGCFMETLLHGFWALAPQRRVGGAEPTPRLERGPAWGEELEGGGPAPWPTYRGDVFRSGATGEGGPSRLTVAWRSRLGVRLSAPVVARDCVVLAEVDSHAVVALEAGSGKLRWRFPVGGRVDSPPTWYLGYLIFGSADGFVYCVRASDGRLVWRFLGAARDLRTVECDRVASVWPVHGSVLVLDGAVFLSAGRNTYLDGGVLLWKLDPEKGTVLARSRLAVRHPRGAEGAKPGTVRRFVQNATDAKTFEAPDRSDAFSMFGARTDVLVSDGSTVYLHTIRFDKNLKVLSQAGRHLFSTSWLLDGAENHRSHWVYGTGDFRRLPVAYSWIANRPRNSWGVRLARPYGLMLAFTAERAWGVRRTPQGYKLFSMPHELLGSEVKVSADFRKIREVGPEKFLWTKSLRFRPRAMLLAGNVLYVAGVPALSSGSWEAFEGKAGGVLGVFQAQRGEKLSSLSLPEAPRWDGMAFGQGTLYIATEKGSVLALRKSPAGP